MNAARAAKSLKDFAITMSSATEKIKVPPNGHLTQMFAFWVRLNHTVLQFIKPHLLIGYNNVKSCRFRTAFPLGAPVAQWVKRWPTDLAVPSSSPARGRIFNRKRGSITQSFIIVRPSPCYD